MKTIRLPICLIVLLVCAVSMETRAQQEYNPFKGFNLGITTQAQLVAPVNFTPVYGPEVDAFAPKGLPGFGYEGGLELSYHFANWFGVSLGLNFGSSAVMNFKAGGKRIPWNRLSDRFHDFFFPLKFEFHYPVSDRFWLVSDLGVKFSGSFQIGGTMMQSTMAVYEDFNDPATYVDLTCVTSGLTSTRAVNADLVFDMGFYYQLPYGDLLRFTAGVNAPMTGTTLSGLYQLTCPAYQYESGGTFTCINNHLNFSAAYIHTFKKLKAKQLDKSWIEELPRHEFQFNVGDPFVAVNYSNLDWLNRNLEHVYSFDPVSWTEPLPDYIHTRCVPSFSFNYNFRVQKWFWVGALTTITGVHGTYRDRLTDAKTGRASEVLWTIMPDVRFSYFNRPHVTLYSGIALGVMLDHVKSREYQGTQAFLGYQLTAFGVKAGGKHWFGNVELGVGHKGIASAGFGYQF